MTIIYVKESGENVGAEKKTFIHSASGVIPQLSSLPSLTNKCLCLKCRNILAVKFLPFER